MMSSQNGALMLPSSIQVIPTQELDGTSKERLPKLVPRSLRPSSTEGSLRVYHAHLDLMNSMIHPDQLDLDWQIECIDTWTIRKYEGEELIFLKVVWAGG